MTTGHVFIATSVDGFVARTDHRIDWLMKQQTEGEDTGYETFTASIDGIVMGRGSYENVLTFGDWPYAKPVKVMSKTLRQADVPAALRARVTVVDADPASLMQQLDEDGWARAYIDGGKLVQSFIRAGLVEDMVLTTVPILIGEGLPLFGSLDADIDLETLESKVFKSGMVQTHYRLVPQER